MAMQAFTKHLHDLMAEVTLSTSRPDFAPFHAPDANSRSQTGYIGVTLHKRTQRYEAHIWSDKKQIYLGSYCRREQAAVAHDIMALKVKGPHAAELNFPNYDYAFFLPLVLNFAQVDLVAALRAYSKSSKPAERGVAANVTIGDQPRAAPLSAPVDPVDTTAKAPTSGMNSLLHRGGRPSKRKQIRPSSSLGSYATGDEDEEPYIPKRLPIPPAQALPPQSPLQGFKASFPGAAGGAAVGPRSPEKPSPIMIEKNVVLGIGLPPRGPHRSDKIVQGVSRKLSAGKTCVPSGVKASNSLSATTPSLPSAGRPEECPGTNTAEPTGGGGLGTPRLGKEQGGGTRQAPLQLPRE